MLASAPVSSLGSSGEIPFFRGFDAIIDGGLPGFERRNVADASEKRRRRSGGPEPWTRFRSPKDTVGRYRSCRPALEVRRPGRLYKRLKSPSNGRFMTLYKGLNPFVI